MTAATRCVNCEYDVTGLPSVVCPECGEDYRVHYVDDRGWRLWRILLGVCVVWTLIATIRHAGGRNPPDSVLLRYVLSSPLQLVAACVAHAAVRSRHWSAKPMIVGVFVAMSLTAAWAWL